MSFLATLLGRTQAPPRDSNVHVLGALHAHRIGVLRDVLTGNVGRAREDATPRDAIERAGHDGATAADERLGMLLTTSMDFGACVQRARATMPHRPARLDARGEPRGFYERLDAAYERAYQQRLAYWSGYWAGHLDGMHDALSLEGRA